MKKKKNVGNGLEDSAEECEMTSDIISRRSGYIQ